MLGEINRFENRVIRRLSAFLVGDTFDLSLVGRETQVSEIDLGCFFVFFYSLHHDQWISIATPEELFFFLFFFLLLFILKKNTQDAVKVN